MKKYLLILTAAMTVLACSNDEERLELETPVVESQVEEDEIAYTPEMKGIIGIWFLSEVNRGFGGISTIAPEESSYSFNVDGSLEVEDVSGREQAWFQPTGKYEYRLDEEAETITIAGSTYRCILEDKNLTIDTGSACDDPIFVFKKRSGSWLHE